MRVFFFWVLFRENGLYTRMRQRNRVSDRKQVGETGVVQIIGATSEERKFNDPIMRVRTTGHLIMDEYALGARHA